MLHTLSVKEHEKGSESCWLAGHFGGVVFCLVCVNCTQLRLDVVTSTLSLPWHGLACPGRY